MGTKKKSQKGEKKQEITSVTRKLKYENKAMLLQLRNRGIKRKNSSSGYSGRGRNSKSLESPTSIKKVKLSSKTNMTVCTSIKKNRGPGFARKKLVSVPPRKRKVHNFRWTQRKSKRAVFASKKLVSVLANKKGTNNPRRGTIRKSKEIRKSSKTTKEPATNLAEEIRSSKSPPRKRKVHHFWWTPKRKSKRAVLKTNTTEKFDLQEMTPNLARRLRSRTTKSAEVSFHTDSDTDTGDDSKATNSKSSEHNRMKRSFVMVKKQEEQQIAAAATFENHLQYCESELDMEVDIKESDCESSSSAVSSDSEDEKFFNEHFHPPPPPVRKIDFNNLDKLYL